MRRVVVFLSIFVLSVNLGGATTRASCVAPELILGDGFRGSREAPVATVGSEVELKGEMFFDGCDDTGGGSAFGCSDESEGDTGPSQDMQVQVRGPITREVRQQPKTAERPIDVEESVVLATVDADSRGSFSTVVRLPEVPEGVYFISVGYVSQRVRLSSE